MEMEIPLSMTGDNLTLIDTAYINLEKLNANQNIKNIILTLFADNGFPFEAWVQLYLLNGNDVVVDSLFITPGLISQAPVNINLKVSSKKLSKLEIPINENKMNLLSNTKHLLIKTIFNTAANPNYIRLYNKYSIDIKMVGDIKYMIQSK